jgi:hypothetical protein
MPFLVSGFWFLVPVPGSGADRSFAEKVLEPETRNQETGSQQISAANHLERGGRSSPTNEMSITG